MHEHIKSPKHSHFFIIKAKLAILQIYFLSPFRITGYLKRHSCRSRYWLHSNPYSRDKGQQRLRSNREIPGEACKFSCSRRCSCMCMLGKMHPQSLQQPSLCKNTIFVFTVLKYLQSH